MPDLTPYIHARDKLREHKAVLTAHGWSGKYLFDGLDVGKAVDYDGVPGILAAIARGGVVVNITENHIEIRQHGLNENWLLSKKGGWTLK